jgi:hypothetical protein
MKAEKAREGSNDRMRASRGTQSLGGVANVQTFASASFSFSKPEDFEMYALAPAAAANAMSS